MSVVKHIIGSLGDLGVEIIKETAKAPVDIVGQALEGGKAGKQNNQQQPTAKFRESSGFPELDRKDVPPRQVLQQFVGSSTAQKEPSVYEKQQQEIVEKQKQQKLQQVFEQKHTIKPISARKKQGLASHVQKQTTEAKFNVKAE